MKRMNKAPRGGFTLLELLVVVAILATVAGGLLVSYDGPETDAAEGTATFNIAATDKAVRAFKVINKVYPDNLDSLVVNDSNAFSVALPPKLQGSDGDETTDAVANSNADDGKLAFHVLTAEGAAALNAAGVTTLRSISGAQTNEPTDIPNRVFDEPTRGRGISVPVAAGARVAIIETLGIGHGDSNRLRDIAGLDLNSQHIVACFGLGNNSTMVTSEVPGGLSEAPFYSKVERDEYGRYLLLFHLASDGADAGATVDAAEYFSTAKFLGVLDTRGDWLDEEYAEFTNQKQ